MHLFEWLDCLEKGSDIDISQILVRHTPPPKVFLVSRLFLLNQLLCYMALYIEGGQTLPSSQIQKIPFAA